MARQKNRTRNWRRRAAAGTMVAISLPVIIGFAALAIDMGMLYSARTELQRTADAAALAGAWELLDKDALTGSAEMSAEDASARATAAAYAARNFVHGESPTVDNTEDIVVGYRANPLNRDETIDTSLPDQLNAIRVVVRRDNTRNGPIALAFANLFGFASSDRGAVATAYIGDSIAGFMVTEESGNAGIMPFALKEDRWLELLSGVSNVGDSFSYDPATAKVTPGSDGILELNLYPGTGDNQLPPGNFGTVDIGSDANSTDVIARQILEGVTAEDLSYHGGSLTFGEDGTFLLNGDTGLSAAIKDELTAIIGQPRSLPLFREVVGNGDNSMFTIVAFVGVRLVDVKMTGAMSKKAVIIQPAHVVDDAVITTTGSSMSYFVHHPPYLIE